MKENYYPEPGENTSYYGGCGIHNYTNRHEWDYCPHCLTEDIKYDKAAKEAHEKFWASIPESQLYPN